MIMNASRSVIKKPKLRNQSIDATVSDKGKETADFHSTIANVPKRSTRRRSTPTECSLTIRKREVSNRYHRHRSISRAHTRCAGVGCENFISDQHKLDVFKGIYQKWKSYFHLKVPKYKSGLLSPSRQDCRHTKVFRSFDNERVNLKEASATLPQSEELFAFECFMKSLAHYAPYFHQNTQENRNIGNQNYVHCHNPEEIEHRALNEIIKKNSSNSVKIKHSLKVATKNRPILHPDGEELKLRKQNITKPLTAKKCRIESTMYPTFHQTVWEFSPNFKLIAQPQRS